MGHHDPPLTVPPAASKPRLAQGRRGGDAGGRRSPAGAVNLPGRVKAGNGCCAVDGSAVGYWGCVGGGGEEGMPQPPPSTAASLGFRARRRGFVLPADTGAWQVGKKTMKTTL